LKINDEKYMNTINEAFQDVVDEADRAIDHQIKKFGMQRISSDSWISVIIEELGETVSECNKNSSPEDVLEELGQTVACLMRLYAEILREADGTAEEEGEIYERHS